MRRVGVVLSLSLLALTCMIFSMSASAETSRACCCAKTGAVECGCGCCCTENLARQESSDEAEGGETERGEGTARIVANVCPCGSEHAPAIPVSGGSGVSQCCLASLTLWRPEALCWSNFRLTSKTADDEYAQEIDPPPPRKSRSFNSILPDASERLRNTPRRQRAGLETAFHSSSFSYLYTTSDDESPSQIDLSGIIPFARRIEAVWHLCRMIRKGVGASCRNLRSLWDETPHLLKICTVSAKVYSAKERLTALLRTKPLHKCRPKRTLKGGAEMT